MRKTGIIPDGSYVDELKDKELFSLQSGTLIFFPFNSLISSLLG